MFVKTVAVLFVLRRCLESYGYGTTPKFNNLREEDLEKKEDQLQSLDESNIVKTTQFDGNDIIDCVDINRQPSLDHYLLKNHKIQRRPSVVPPIMQSSFPMDTQEYESGFSRKEDCPDGTVPIYRTTQDQMEKAQNISRQMFHNVGRRSTNSLYANPDDHASRPVNGDSFPRLFIYWSVDGGVKTGCYNFLCKGSIQTHPRIGPKSRLIPVSTIGGETYDMKFIIYQDPVTGNWWFAISNQNQMLGYWPKELVPRLAKAATDVAWGGIGLAGRDGISPPIGSGQYPDGFYDRAAFWRGILYLRKGLKPVAPSDQDDVKEVVDKSGCYGLQNDKLTKSEYWGYRFSFGGPGGSTCKH